MNSTYFPQPTNPQDVLAARIQEERELKARLAFDAELIRRMEEGPMIDAAEVNWDKVYQKAVRIAASRGGQR